MKNNFFINHELEPGEYRLGVKEGVPEGDM